MQTPTAIAIVIAVAMIWFAWLFPRQNYQAEKVEKERVAQEAAQEKEKQIEDDKIAEEKQSKELRDLVSKQQNEINKLSEENKKRQEADLLEKCANLNSAIDRLNAGCPANSKPQPQTITVLPQNSGQQTVADLAKFIVRIICSDGASSNLNESQITSGSGTIFGLNKFVITNFHVVEGAVLCGVGITDDIKKSPYRWYEAEVTPKIPSLDIALLKPSQPLPDSVATITHNLCRPDEINLGDEIIVLGYPVVGGNTITATDGVISGFDGFFIKTSAKIEHGNSGGGAFLKKYGCWFGIPTSATQGELESLGRIINYSLIHQKTYE